MNLCHKLGVFNKEKSPDGSQCFQYWDSDVWKSGKKHVGYQTHTTAADRGAEVQTTTAIKFPH